jgi:hypothetical protein
MVEALPQVRRRFRPVLVAASFFAGLVLSWLVLGQLWVEFESLVPMWAAAFILSVSGIALCIRVRAVEGRATAAGLLTSAVVCTTFWTWLSSGPTLV